MYRIQPKINKKQIIVAILILYLIQNIYHKSRKHSLKIRNMNMK